MEYSTKEPKWQEGVKASTLARHRTSSVLVSNGALGRAERMDRCMDTVISLDCPEGHHSHITRANMCRDRLCPFCNSRRSHKLAGQIHEILRVAHERHTPKYAFLTLTIKSVEGKYLDESIKSLSKNCKALMEYDEIKEYLHGYIRTIEVTCDSNADRYHPHIHVLLALKLTYFSRYGYIRQSRWVELWQRAADLEYTPVVDVRAIKPKPGREAKDTLGAAQEVASYSVKSDQYAAPEMPQAVTERVVSVLMDAMKGHRLIAFGGVLKKIRAELKLERVENDGADLTDGKCDNPKCPVCGLMLVEILHSRGNISLGK